MQAEPATTRMLKVAIIMGSTRPGRIVEPIARWVHEVAAQRTDAAYELIDIADYHLPLLDEPLPPSFGRYSQAHTKNWSAKIAGFDAFVFVTPEYNHGIPAALKNAIDFLYAEWNNKAAAFVSYGGAGGVRAVEQLRLVMAEIRVADIRSHLSLSLFTDFENYSAFKPRAQHVAELNVMLDELAVWGRALRVIRSVVDSGERDTA